MAVIIGIIISLAVFASGIIFSGGSMMLFLDIPSFIIILGFNIGALAVSDGFKPFWIGLTALMGKGSGAGKEDLMAAAESFDLMARCSIGGGFIGLLMATVMLLVNLNDTAHLGPYLAIAILTVLYGFMLAFLFFYPGKTRILRLARK